MLKIFFFKIYNFMVSFLLIGPSPRILLLVALGVLTSVGALTVFSAQELESDTAEPLDVTMATLDPEAQPIA